MMMMMMTMIRRYHAAVGYSCRPVDVNQARASITARGVAELESQKGPA